MKLSTTHLVLIPSYNTGPRLAVTVEEALVQWSPVWVVVDGSTDGSATAVQAWVAKRADDVDLRWPVYWVKTNLPWFLRPTNCLHCPRSAAASRLTVPYVVGIGNVV